jgi:hypothetical protein
MSVQGYTDHLYISNYNNLPNITSYASIKLLIISWLHAVLRSSSCCIPRDATNWSILFGLCLLANIGCFGHSIAIVVQMVVSNHLCRCYSVLLCSFLLMDSFFATRLAILVSRFLEFIIFENFGIVHIEADANNSTILDSLIAGGN